METKDLSNYHGSMRFIPEKGIIECHGSVRLILEDVVTGKIEVTLWKHNLITTAGKIAILRRLANKATKTNEGMVTYGAVGTGSTQPAITDTTLVTELARKSVTYGTITGTKLSLRCFFNTSEGNGALTEFGWFGEDASAVGGTGTLFNRILISKTKTSAKTLTIEQEIEIA